MKVMIVDTVGTQFPQYFRDYFPHVKLRGYDLTDEVATHPHGWMCGYYATILLNLLPGNHEAVYVRIFDSKGAPIPKSNEMVLKVLAEERPNIITNSWGQWDSDTRWGDRMGNVAWQQWSEIYDSLCEEIGCTSFFAAGNNDVNDQDADVDYPGRLLAGGQTCVIGSHRRNGIPSEFSGDGKEVLCTFWAENVQLLAGDKWERGSGTSFACPKAAGLSAYLRLNTQDFKSYAIAHASKPDYYTGELPNPKWGHGSLEHKYQEKFAMLREELLPPRMSSLALTDFYHDFKIVDV